jgi:hypothetical protein
LDPQRLSLLKLIPPKAEIDLEFCRLYESSGVLNRVLIRERSHQENNLITRDTTKTIHFDFNSIKKDDMAVLLIQFGQFIAIINGIILRKCEFCNNCLKLCKFSVVKRFTFAM